MKLDAETCLNYKHWYLWDSDWPNSFV